MASVCRRQLQPEILATRSNHEGERQGCPCYLAMAFARTRALATESGVGDGAQREHAADGERRPLSRFWPRSGLGYRSRYGSDPVDLRSGRLESGSAEQ